MAKTMAKIENGVVVNMIWCSDDAAENDTLKNVNDRPVGIGDTYSDGKFYRDGAEVLTPLEAALAENEMYREQMSELDDVYREGVESAWT